MKNKTILIHIKNEEALNDFVKLLSHPELASELSYSREIKAMTNEFVQNGWLCYIGTLLNFDLETGIYHHVYCIQNQQYYDLSIEELNSHIPVMIVRNIGPMEPNYVNIQNYLNYMIEHYQGKIINNPKAMLKGMSKYYLAEIDPQKLAEFHIKAIPTKVFPRTVTFQEIEDSYPLNREDYLIKPLAGELSNSLKCLNDVDEEFFRYKEDKVQGWLVQPIQKEIWNGEFQLVFLDGKVIYGQQKSYVHDGYTVPSQKTRVIDKYDPSLQEIECLKKLIAYMEDFYHISIDICRIDFMKDNEGNLILLEFEMVNPGFFIVYQDENSTEVQKIVKSIRIYCENQLR